MFDLIKDVIKDLNFLIKENYKVVLAPPEINDLKKIFNSSLSNEFKEELLLNIEKYLEGYTSMLSKNKGILLVYKNKVSRTREKFYYYEPATKKAYTSSAERRSYSQEGSTWDKTEEVEFYVDSALREAGEDDLPSHWEWYTKEVVKAYDFFLSLSSFYNSLF